MATRANSSKYITGADTSGNGNSSSYDVFISHCKRAPGSEDRALWIADVFEEAGMSTFFDLQNLEEISQEQLRADVLKSKCLVTVLDPETFKSQWVVLENQTAAENGTPIVIFFDGDKYAWNELSFWVEEFPAFFKIPAIEYEPGPDAAAPRCPHCVQC